MRDAQLKPLQGLPPSSPAVRTGFNAPASPFTSCMLDMPVTANLGGGAGNTPADFWRSLPPVIKLYGAACVATTIAAGLGVLPYPLIVLLWPRILRRLEVR